MFSPDPDDAKEKLSLFLSVYPFPLLRFIFK